MKLQVDVLTRELYLELFILWFWGADERYLDFKTGDSTQNFDTNLMRIVVWPAKPGEPY